MALLEHLEGTQRMAGVMEATTELGMELVAGVLGEQVPVTAPQVRMVG